MIGVQVGKENDIEFGRCERWSGARGECGATNNSRAGVNEVGVAVHNNCDGWSGSIGVGVGCAGAEHDERRLGVRVR